MKSGRIFLQEEQEGSLLGKSDSPGRRIPYCKTSEGTVFKPEGAGTF